MAMIEVKNLYKVFGKNPERALTLLEQGLSKEEIMEKTKLTVGVQNVSFEVQRGESFVVMGLSGSGKSTLVRCLNRLIEPTHGTVVIDDKDVTRMDSDELRTLRRDKLGMVFQSFAIFPHKTVLDNAAYGLKVMGLSHEERSKKARETLEMVGLVGYEDAYPSALSGGMQQRVGLARALATDPEILLMDEAFSALDPLIRKEMQSELLELQDQMRKTIVFITHDLDEALRIGDRIAMMREGEIVQIGTPEEIMMSPSAGYVEKFVEDVDRSQLLTAEMIMKKPTSTLVYPKDGPRTALRKMDTYDISSVFVVDRDNKLLGIVSAEDALSAAKSGHSSLESILVSDIPKVAPETQLREMFSMLTGKNLPLAVVNSEGRFLGIVLRGAVMAKLASGGEDE